MRNTVEPFIPITILLAFIILIGRVVGFVREIYVASVFGLSTLTDWAILLLTTPDFLVGLLMSGGLAAALVPEFRSYGVEERTRIYFSVSLIAFTTFGSIALVITLFPQILIVILAPGLYESDYPRLAFTIMTIAIPLSALSGVSAALLNAENKFIVAGSGTLVFNLALLATLAVAITFAENILALAIAISVAALARTALLVTQASTLINHSTRLTFFSLPDGLRLRFFAAMGASSIMLLAPIAIRSAASLSGQGNLAAVNFAHKLIELPLTLAISTVVTIAFTKLSDLFAAGKVAAAQQFHTEITLMLVLGALAIVLPTLWFSNSLVAFIYQRGEISADDVSTILSLFRIGILALPFAAISSMGAAVLNAKKETTKVLRSSLIASSTLLAVLVLSVLVDSLTVAMFALVIFFAVLSFLVAWDSRLSASIESLSSFSMRAFLGAIACTPFVAIDTYFDLSDDLLRVLLCGSCIVSAVWATGAHRKLKLLTI